MKTLILILILLSSTLSFSATPSQWTCNLDKGTGEVVFHSVGRPSGIKIVGKGEPAHGKLLFSGTGLAGVATFKLDTLDTGISMRNEHMKKKYLEVEKFPESKFTIEKLDLPAAAASGQDFSVDHATFHGKLFLHGVEKPVDGFAKVERKGNQLSADAEYELSINDYSIDIPSFAGIKMADHVTVDVKVSAPIESAP